MVSKCQMSHVQGWDDMNKPKIIILEGETEAEVTIVTDNEELKHGIIVKVSEAMVPYFGSRSCLTVREKNHGKE